MNYLVDTSHPDEVATATLAPKINEAHAWRDLFKRRGEMDQSPMKFPIKNFLPEGITFIGALPGSGKTWLCLSMAKALCTGQNFLGTLEVPERCNVLYLIPEAGERSFHDRLTMIDMPDDESFLCRTMSDGSIKLNDPGLWAAVSELHPVVFLDTAVRFNDSKDENDASQSAKLLTDALFALLQKGARAVVCAHHSTKAAGNTISLETALRGTGELGANADAVYYLQVKDSASLRVCIRNVKARDFEALPPIEVVGRPHLELTGDFQPAQPIDAPHYAKQDQERQRLLLAAISADPNATYTTLATTLGLPRAAIYRIAAKAGLKKGNGIQWERWAA